MRDAVPRLLARGDFSAWVLAIILTIPGAVTAGVEESVDQFKSGGVIVTVDRFAPTARGKHPLVVMLHGSGGLEQATGDVFQAIARKMAARGYVVLIPHYFDRPGSPTEWLEVVADAIKFGAESNVVDRERIGLFGFSMGASLAFHRSARDPNVRAVVAVSGPMPLGSGARFPPTLLLLGAQDHGIPRDDVKKGEEEMKARNVTCVVHIYPHLGHNLSIPRFLDAGKRATEFFDKHVREKTTRPGGVEASKVRDLAPGA
jgi:dienelactone hydrolase